MDIFDPISASNFSFLRGASHPQEMVMAAHAYGLKGLGLADYNTLAGVVRAHGAAKKIGLRLIVGARLVEEDTGFHTVIYPTDRAGWGRLSLALTKGNRRSKKGTCTLFLDDILFAAGGNCAILMPPHPLSEQWLAAAKMRLNQMKAGQLPAHKIYVALTHYFDGTDRARFVALSHLCEEAGVTLLATQDSLFHHENRQMMADVVAAIRTGTILADAGADSGAYSGKKRLANGERCLKPAGEMARLFDHASESLQAASALFDAIQFSLDDLRYEYPDEILTDGLSPMESLKQKTEAGAKERYPDGIPQKVRQQIDHEYDLIEQMDYARYFLTVSDIVTFARRENILCQGRGSAANSAVCFCLGITAVDPTKVDLLFERFISPERSEPPDIDVDFEHERREEVIQYIYQKYGRHRAGIAATVVCYRGKSALREVGKVLGLSLDAITGLSKSVWGHGRHSVDEGHIANMSGLDPQAPIIHAAIKLARQLQGFPRHLSQHVGGFVMTRDRLDACVPISNAAMEDRTFIEWDKDDIETLGMLKMDVLALGMLTAIQNGFTLLAAHKNINMGLADVPPEDPLVYAMISAADTIGVFQIESRAQMSMLPRLRPRTFYDLVIEVAIVRPGPIQGDMVHPYLRRRQGLERVSFPSKELESVLGKTLGVPLFQEQAMRIAIVAAGFTPSEADQLRRAMATFRKVGIIHKFGEKLIGGMVANGYDKGFAERCFRQIEGFGEYGFPESHAASFALLVYVSAWLKCHHPDVFLAAILNAQPMGFYSTAQLVRDGRDHGVVVLPPDVNQAAWDSDLEGPPNHLGRKSVRLGFREIVGLSAAEIGRLLAAREEGGPFISPLDLMRRAKLSKRTMTLLAAADSLKSLASAPNDKGHKCLSRRDALWQTQGLADKPLPLFAHMDEYGPEAGQLPQLTASSDMVADYRAMRLSLKAHPIGFFRPAIRAAYGKNAQEIAQLNDRIIACGGLVLLRQQPGTAKGVLFMTLEDETGTINLIVWPKIFARFRAIALRSKFLWVRGRVQTQDGVTHVIVQHMIDYTPSLSQLEAQTDLKYRLIAFENSHQPLANTPSGDSHGHPRQVNPFGRSRNFH